MFDGICYSIFHLCWTSTHTTFIHSHHIKNHIPIRIIVGTWNLPNHLFYHDLMSNKFLSVHTKKYIPPWTEKIYSSMNSFCIRCIMTISGSINLLFFTLYMTFNTVSTNISWIRYCVVNKIQNLITIIHPTQTLR